MTLGLAAGGWLDAAICYNLTKRVPAGLRMAAEHLRRGEVQQRLAGFGWFAELDRHLAEAVLDAGRQLALARGAPVFHPQGDPGGIFGVISGGVVISTVGRDGLSVAGHIMRRGAWFGSGAVLFRLNRTLLAEANEPSLLLHVPLAQIEGIRAAFPGADLAFRLLAAYGETAILNVVADLLISGAEQRLASVLLRVAGVGPGAARRHACGPFRRPLGRAADPGDAGGPRERLAPDGRPLRRPRDGRGLDRMDVRTRAHTGSPWIVGLCVGTLAAIDPSARAPRWSAGPLSRRQGHAASQWPRGTEGEGCDENR